MDYPFHYLCKAAPSPQKKKKKSEKGAVLRLSVNPIETLF